MESRLPLVLLILPWVAAVAALVAGRWRRGVAAIGLVGVAALATLIVLAMSLSGDPTTTVFGRTLTLTPLARGLLLLLYALAGGLMVLHGFRPVSPSFVASALVVLSPLAAALLVQPPGLALAMWGVALALLTIALTGGQSEASRAAWRAFLLGVLGLLPLLWVAWAQSAGQVGVVLPPALLLATLLLLGGFPFHVAWRGLARWSPTGALALALGVGQVVVVALLFGLLDLVPAARAAAEFQTALRGSAVLSALLAAFLMARERTWRGALGGALLLDAGCLTLAALAPGAAGLAVALAALIGRTLSLLLVAVGLSWPDSAGGPTARLQAALLLYGSLSLLGLPLTPGFAGRWAQLSLLGAAGPWAAVVLLAALGAAVWGLWGLWRTERGVTIGEADSGFAVVAAWPVGRVEQIAALLLLGLAALLGLFPGLLTSLAARLAG